MFSGAYSSVSMLWIAALAGSSYKWICWILPGNEQYQDYIGNVIFPLNSFFYLACVVPDLIVNLTYRLILPLPRTADNKGDTAVGFSICVDGVYTLPSFTLLKNLKSTDCIILNSSWNYHFDTFDICRNFDNPKLKRIEKEVCDKQEQIQKQHLKGQDNIVYSNVSKSE